MAQPTDQTSASPPTPSQPQQPPVLPGRPGPNPGPNQGQAPGSPAPNQALAKVRHLIAVASGKGGVGKSTVAVNLAHAFAAAGAAGAAEAGAAGAASGGARVGILDCDIYGPSVPGMVGLGEFRLGPEQALPGGRLRPVEAYGLKVMSMGFLTTRETPVIWRGPMASQLIQQFLGGVEWGELDYLFIDLPPGTGDIQLTLAQSVPLTGAVIVTTPQMVAHSIAEKGLRMFQQVQVPILGIVENMSYYHCPQCGHDDPIFRSGGGQKAAEALDLPLLGRIPLNGTIAEAGDAGVPLIALDADSELAKAYLTLAEGVKAQVALQAQREAENQHRPAKVELTADGRLAIQWADDLQTSLTPRTLRLACPCASCVEEFTGRKLLDPATVPHEITLQEATPVGRYALRFTFSDGHGSGLYNFNRLRELGQEKPAEPQAAAFEV